MCALVCQTGSLSDAYRFAPKGKGSLLSYLEHRKGLGPTELGSFVYEPSKGNLNTVALDGTIPADQIRIQVRALVLFWLAEMWGCYLLWLLNGLRHDSPDIIHV